MLCASTVGVSRRPEQGLSEVIFAWKSEDEMWVSGWRNSGSKGYIKGPRGALLLKESYHVCGENSI